MRAGRRGRHGKLAALHRGVGPGEAAAGEHRDRDVLRRRVAGDADVKALGADVGDRDHAGPKRQVESSFTQAAVSASACRAGAAASAGTAKLAPSPPNTKGKSRSSSALVTATITAAPAMLTAL